MRRYSAQQLLFIALLWLSSLAAHACPVCRPRVQAGIHDAAYSANLLLVLLPVALLLAGGLGLFFAEDLRRLRSPFRPRPA